MWLRLFKRLMNIFKAKANDTLDNIEDPVQMIKLAVVELEEAISKAIKALSVAVANQKKLEKDYEQFRLEALGWYQKATAALEIGNEELAQKALAQKANADKKALEYQLLSENSKQMVASLTAQTDKYKLKLQEAKTKESIYAAKAENAKAQKQIAESLGGINGSALANIDKYEQKINQLEAEAESLTQMNSSQNVLEDEFRTLETNFSVQNDMEKLKEEIEQKKLQKAQQKQIEIEQKMNNMNNAAKSTTQNLPPASIPIQIQEKNKIDNHIDNFFKK
ncbi:MAG: PspA/IM30 family protein [Cytophagales bacterium]